MTTMMIAMIHGKRIGTAGTDDEVQDSEDVERQMVHRVFPRRASRAGLCHRRHLGRSPQDRLGPHHPGADMQGGIGVRIYGQIAYEAYRAHTGGVSPATGAPIPQWEQLPAPIQAAWEAAGSVVREEVASPHVRVFE